MKSLRHINIKNYQNYFFNSLTNIKNFDLTLLSINEMSFTSGVVLFVTLNILKVWTVEIFFILFLIM